MSGKSDISFLSFTSTRTTSAVSGWITKNKIKKKIDTVAFIIPPMRHFAAQTGNGHRTQCRISSGDDETGETKPDRILQHFLLRWLDDRSSRGFASPDRCE
jgi:hypothetical protein